jgi:hypothetical protein
MMSSSPQFDSMQLTDRFYAMLKSLGEFDKQEILGVIKTLISTSARERCFISTYYRCTAKVGTLLELKQTKHFQAVAMLARGLFELAVDMRLIDIIPDSINKILEFTDVEKLRCAKKVLRFATANPTSKLDTSVYRSFVANNESRIEATKKILWPNKGKVEHWSGLRLSDRIASVKAPFEEIYEVSYPQLSWYVPRGRPES